MLRTAVVSRQRKSNRRKSAGQVPQLPRAVNQGCLRSVCAYTACHKSMNFPFALGVRHRRKQHLSIGGRAMNPKEWTIMIYMAGDNNLAVDMAYAMEQIKGVAGEGADSRNVLVYYDGNSPQIPTLYCDFSDPQAQLQEQYVPSVTVTDKLYPVPRKWNENAADPKSVKNFVNWCVNTRGRRANRYALIFSGHSLGFLDKGLFKDETAGKAMKIEDLFFLIQRLILPAEALAEMAEDRGCEGEKLARETTPLLGQHLDILGFDSCVMGMLEVGYQFQDLTHTMIVSEGSVPSAGWSYAKILGGLCGGKHSTEEVAAKFVKEFIRGQDKFIVGGVTVDMAAWSMDGDGFNALADAFDGLAQALLDCFADEESRIYKQMERIILQVHWKCQSYMYDQTVDLGDFCHLLQKECQSVAEELGSDDTGLLEAVQDCCQRVLSELEKIVLLSGFSGGGYQYSNGVSVFFPWSWEGYLVSRENYESLWFTKDRKNSNFDARWKGWADFLKKYLSDVTYRKAEPLTPDAPLGAKYRYRSGVILDEPSEPMPLSGSETPLTKMGTSQTSKMGSSQSSKMGSSQTSKMGSSQTSKMGSSQTSKMGSSQTSKLGGGGVDAFYEKLKLWKNIESRFDISGFTKRPAEDEPEAASPYET
ncbi:MAG TPA: clostripain-related cysteine peptidase [Blastocatellia bacterium]|nr:clostripain-related cysteine peptidase [Blastocatellia bacterium]